LRINLYLSENNEKDIIITNYLKLKYSPKDYIKEMLYAAAIGQNIVPISLVNKEVVIASEDEYEEIQGIDGIDI
jgi:hypothetical protein